VGSGVRARLNGWHSNHCPQRAPLLLQGDGWSIVLMGQEIPDMTYLTEYWATIPNMPTKPRRALFVLAFWPVDVRYTQER